ncbi:MAG: serine hydrolase [Bacteroidetes bacterium]|nr:serine hydrolase [Bacteroidota bacterium]
MKYLLPAILIVLVIFPSSIPLHNEVAQLSIQPDFIIQESKWVDSVFNNMNQDERIGQLFMVPVWSHKKNVMLKGKMVGYVEYRNYVKKLIKQYGIGGLIFMQGGPVRQARLNNELQGLSRVPMLIAMDAEWGLGMRLDSVLDFPRQLSLGALQDNQLIYQMGIEVARQMKRLGVHVNFAPVVDVNNNPKNPVINDRSFGENKFNVTVKGLAYMKGMEKGGVLACAKHFPGHGDTDKDSHHQLPTIAHSRERLDSLELYPFKKLINSGVSSVMTAHLYIPALDDRKNVAASISGAVINDLLKKELGFEGLVFTDALNMKGVSKYYEPGNLEVAALEAGNDVLLFPENVPKAVEMINVALNKGQLSQQDLDRSAKKILKAKYWAGLHTYKPVDINNITKDITSKKTELLKRKLVAGSLTLVRNKDSLIPFKMLDTLSFASLSIGSRVKTAFQNMLGKYTSFDHHQLSKKATSVEFMAMIDKLSKKNLVVIGLHNMSRYNSKRYGVSELTKTFINRLSEKTKVVVVVFGNPYSIKYFEKTDWLVVGYEDDDLNQSLAAQLLFGGLRAQGRLPITASKIFPFGNGFQTNNSIRIEFSIPEDVGIRSENLKVIDTIVMNGIRQMAMPGCQVFIIKNNKVIFERSYGYHTYKRKRKVQNDHLYDLASITKIAVTMPSLMRMYELGQFNIRKQLSYYIPDLDDKKTGDLIIRNVLLHQSGLRDWIPFYLHTLTPDGNCDENYRSSPTAMFTSKVADNLYILDTYQDTIWNKIINAKLRKRKEYKYSDLGFYIFKKIIEDINQESLESYVQENFHGPLGLQYTLYNPLDKFTKEQIVPTEDDKIFRHQLIHGYVHDPGAAMMGGISGHAGLFSNAGDVAIYMQMLLNGGSYGGESFFNPKTIKKFTSRISRDNRRGLGFDKPESDPNKVGPSSPSASLNTFGHSGFTGNITWADPDHELVYVFLSNRVHPDANNRKLIKMNIRTDIQESIYEAIRKGINNSVLEGSKFVKEGSNKN